jgi:uncharacterized membrane protein YciS (DUF1049 family)
MLHLVISLLITVACFSFLNQHSSIELLFANTLLRLGTIVVIWAISGLAIGWLIEVFLEASDEEYKVWKKARGTE